jgi:FtsP/CotA-like multicopper oxidase with cupredoxin domain
MILAAVVLFLGIDQECTIAAMNPGGTPDYFNVPNWANSPLPTVNPINKKITGGVRKFIDTLPGVGPFNANNLGQYIPIANPDTNTYPGSDYYEISLVEYSEKMHTDLPPTRLRGYVQTNNGTDAAGANTIAPAPVHYLGPLIIAQRDRPVRIKFTNNLPTGADGNLFIPVDTTVMGAGMGPLEEAVPPGYPLNYSQNRAILHLHGGTTPWISDGTPHQWVTPAGETTAYPTGVSTQNVPDMPNPGPGSVTLYYTNQQSARLMFYHDHAYGITRLNVYAGEAAGYVVTDPVEEDLISVKKVIPDLGGVYHYGVPLVIQDKTFVDANNIAATDPTWNWGTTRPTPHTGDLWFPHVYMPNQNPNKESGASDFGRWDYGPWFWPPFSAAAGLIHGPVQIGVNDSNEPIYAPGTPNPSLVPEAFMDTPLVNGTPYPYLNVARRAYRFRILNACNDRFLNLQLYYADSAKPTEVKMVPAVSTPGFPATWPTDGRDGGVPDPRKAGPPIIQIGTEGGFLPEPVVLENTPIGYNYNRRDIVVLNVENHTLFLGPAERADVIIDFSKVKKGAKLILYNDAPAPVPAFDSRYDYYTDDPNQTDTGGAPTTLKGYGPNTRTIMQFRVTGTTASPAFDVNALNAVLPAAYAASQPAPIVPQTTYPAPYNAAIDTYSRIQDTNLTFTPVDSNTPITVPMKPKAIQELFELNYGRMNATMGVELPFTNAQNQTTIPLGYIDPPTEIIQDGNAQIWKITHNGVDTHAIHFHLFNVQVINRVGWDGAIRPPERNELGWKETVRMNPLEDCIVAFQPIAPKLPFAIPDSNRPIDPTAPLGSTFQSIDPITNQAYDVNNVLTNFGWEYVWHCHLLGHEENDMMRPLVMENVTNYVTPVTAPRGLTADVNTTQKIKLAWTDTSNKETGFRIERAIEPNAFAEINTVDVNVTDYNDTNVVPGITYTYRVLDFNSDGNSLPSNTVMVTAAAPAVPSNLVATASAAGINPPTVSLTWVDNSNNEAGFTIQRATNSGFTKGLTTITVGANVTTYTDSTVIAKKKYYYKIRAFNAIGDSEYVKPVRVTTLP